MSNDLLSRRAHRSGADDVVGDYPISDNRDERRVAAVTPEERAESVIDYGRLWLKHQFAEAIRQARDEAIEEAAKVADKRRDTWRAEADTYSEADQAKFVRNIRAGEAQNIAAAIRSLKGKS